MKSFWKDVPEKKRYIETKTGGGIHTGLPETEIPGGMATDMKNLHSAHYPHLCPRPPRDKAAVPRLPEGEVRFFGVIFGTTLSAVVGKTLYTLSEGAWKSEGDLFTKETGRVYGADFMDYAVFADGDECKKFDGAAISDVGKKGKPENALYLVTHAWHLFTASDKDKFLRYSAVENIDDWSAPMDAGQELLETTKEAYAGGLAAYGGHVIYFKRNAMFELYGTDPVNFSLLCLSRDIGCMAQESIREIGGILYFLGRDGVYRYGGGTIPKKISFPIRKYIENMDTEKADKVASGSDGERYYLSLPQKGGGQQLLVYDTRIGEWFKEDDVPIFAFAEYGGKLYMAEEDGTVSVFGGGDEMVEWYRISAPFIFENSLFQNWHRIYIRAEVEKGASFTVSLSPWLDMEYFRTVATVSKSGLTVIEIPPQMQDAPQMRIKLSGRGAVRISAIEFEMRARKRSYA
ncbi:MAG: hypothetical protein IJN74_03185 [Clostridia bacterium]|nr:hypothetical protein [Clostridia bacterium]